MNKTLATLLLVSTLALGLSACNTMAGIGKDVQRAGEKIQDVTRR